jgi:hypothetical protein
MAEAVRGRKWLGLFISHPFPRISPFDRLLLRLRGYIIKSHEVLAGVKPTRRRPVYIDHLVDRRSKVRVRRKNFRAKPFVCMMPFL